MVFRRPQRNYTSCELGIWHINKVFILLLLVAVVEYNTH